MKRWSHSLQGNPETVDGSIPVLSDPNHSLKQKFFRLKGFGLLINFLSSSGQTTGDCWGKTLLKSLVHGFLVGQ